MHILIIEDEPKMSAILRDGMTREGHLVTIAKDGEEGLSLAMDCDFGAVILIVCCRSSMERRSRDDCDSRAVSLRY